MGDRNKNRLETWAKGKRRKGPFAKAPGNEDRVGIRTVRLHEESAGGQRRHTFSAGAFPLPSLFFLPVGGSFPGGAVRLGLRH